MKEQFVSYEIALKLKELGFDEHCLGIYVSQQLNPYLMYSSQHDVFMATNNDGILAPLWQQVIDWFREKHNVDICINPVRYVGYEEIAYWTYSIMGISPIRYNKFDKYQDARETAISKAIELKKSE
jgi:hypothetical protein